MARPLQCFVAPAFERLQGAAVTSTNPLVRTIVQTARIDLRRGRTEIFARSVKLLTVVCSGVLDGRISFGAVGPRVRGARPGRSSITGREPHALPQLGRSRRSAGHALPDDGRGGGVGRR